MSSLNHDFIVSAVTAFLEKELKNLPGPLAPGAELAALGADSLTLVKLIIFIEKKFGVSIPDDRLTSENFNTVESISRCVQENAL